MFSDWSSLKRLSFLHYIKIGELKYNITDPLMLKHFFFKIYFTSATLFSLLSLPLFYCIGKTLISHIFNTFVTNGVKINT